MMVDMGDCGFVNQEYAAFPPVVQIAVVAGNCSARCVRCPMGRVLFGDASKDEILEMSRVASFPYGLFKRIANEIAEYPGVILRLHGRGEPMLHPDYLDMVEYARKAGVSIITSFTNGISLDEASSYRLLQTPIDLLEVSVDASDSEHYKRWRRTDCFEKVVRNVQRFVDIRRELGVGTTRLVVSAVGHEEFDEEQQQLFKDFWSPLADLVIVRPYHTYAGRLRPIAPCSGAYTPCPQLWERFSISPDGLVNACFNDWGDKETVGDLRKCGSSIASIWRNSEFDNIRRASISNPYLACCKSCSGASISSKGNGSYQVWVRDLLARPMVVYRERSHGELRVHSL